MWIAAQDSVCDMSRPAARAAVFQDTPDNWLYAWNGRDTSFSVRKGVFRHLEGACDWQMSMINIFLTRYWINLKRIVYLTCLGKCRCTKVFINAQNKIRSCKDLIAGRAYSIPIISRRTVGYPACKNGRSLKFVTTLSAPRLSSARYIHSQSVKIQHLLLQNEFILVRNNNHDHLVLFWSLDVTKLKRYSIFGSMSYHLTVANRDSL